MSERFHAILKIICLGLAALVFYQIVSLAARKDPLAQLSFAAMPIVAAPETRIEKTQTNVLPPQAAAEKQTNSLPRQSSGKKVTSSGPRPPAAEAQSALPPAVQTRIDRITASEILGAVVRPLPMALLGIAGKDAFLRAPNGQTGLLREGEELGGVKLLRIGTNRVLIEHEQQQKELTVFSGFGSETLIPKGKANPQ